jgi:hypothetical protein
MAHDEAGHPVETAASLFDAGDEATVDFFASSFNEDGSQGQSSSHSHDSDVASNLFEAGPDESTASFYQSVTHDPLLSNGSGVLNSESHPEAPPGHSVDSQTNYSSSTAYQSQGWQDEHGQWHLYDNQSQYTSTYDYACMSFFISFCSIQSPFTFI